MRIGPPSLDHIRTCIAGLVLPLPAEVYMRLTLKRQILAFSILPILVMACIATAFSISSILSLGEDRIARYREQLILQKKKELANYVEIVLKVIERMSSEEAAETIRRITYGDKDYFWINDFECRMLSHPDPRLNGADLSDLRDPNGVYIIREMVKACRENGQGYVPYAWKKLGAETPQPKLSYVRTVDHWHWILGTGLYVDDIDSLVNQERARMEMIISSLIVKNILIALGVATLIAVMVAYFVNARVNRPMRIVVEAMRDFDNDLTRRIGGNFKNEFAELASQFNGLVDKLSEIIAKVSEVTYDLSDSITEISATIEEQAAISTEQSASVSEITSTMEEFTVTSKQISEHAASVSDLAGRALDNTRKGADSVETIMMKMKEINEDNNNNLNEIVALGKRSREITKVMEIINGIADQTKLIAFNAALEASSAGEAGKRFGVVAAEIRRLADNVMESTGEIDSRIQEIQEAVGRLVIVSENGAKRVQEGLEYSNETAQMISELLIGAKATASAAKQISLSTQQQESASEQVVQALREIDEGARQTSGSIGQASSATNDLKRMSDNLKSLVNQFKVVAGERKD